MTTEKRPKRQTNPNSKQGAYSGDAKRINKSRRKRASKK